MGCPYDFHGTSHRNVYRYEVLMAFQGIPLVDLFELFLGVIKQHRLCVIFIEAY